MYEVKIGLLVLLPINIYELQLLIRKSQYNKYWSLKIRSAKHSTV